MVAVARPMGPSEDGSSLGAGVELEKLPPAPVLDAFMFGSLSGEGEKNSRARTLYQHCVRF